MAPTPKPKELRQNRIKRPELGLVDATPLPFIPEPPRGLLKKTRRVWDSYWRSQVARVVDPNADAHRIERWIRAVDEYERVYVTFRRKRIVSGSTGQLALNPLATYIQRLEASIQRAELELGLTPLARLKLGVAYGEAQLTAEALNRQLDAELEASPDDQALEAEWAEA